MTKQTLWTVILLLSALAVIAAGIYAFSGSGSVPLALILAVPFVILGRISYRQLRAHSPKPPA
jgi:uncharacterized membrane protein